MKNRPIYIFFILLTLTGCMAKFKNITNTYSSVIGVELETTKDLLIYGYTLTLEKNKKLNGYVIHDYPGVSGPEYLSESILPKGTIFTIQRVEKCSNCWPFPAYKNFFIKITSTNIYDNHETHLRDYLYLQRGRVWKRHVPNTTY